MLASKVSAGLIGLCAIASLVVGCGRRLEFVVIDASTGAPLADVAVRGASGVMGPVPVVTPRVSLGKTDVNGHWRTPPLGTVDVHHYEFEKAGYRGATAEQSYDEDEVNVWIDGAEKYTDVSQSASGPVRIALPRADGGSVPSSRPGR